MSIEKFMFRYLGPRLAHSAPPHGPSVSHRRRRRRVPAQSPDRGVCSAVCLGGSSNPCWTRVLDPEPSSSNFPLRPRRAVALRRVFGAGAGKTIPVRLLDLLGGGS